MALLPFVIPAKAGIPLFFPTIAEGSSGTLAFAGVTVGEQPS